MREQGLTFTHEWEKPTSAVLNEFLAHHDRPGTRAIVGMEVQVSSYDDYLAKRNLIAPQTRVNWNGAGESTPRTICMTPRWPSARPTIAS